MDHAPEERDFASVKGELIRARPPLVQPGGQTLPETWSLIIPSNHPKSEAVYVQDTPHGSDPDRSLDTQIKSTVLSSGVGCILRRPVQHVSASLLASSCQANPERPGRLRSREPGRKRPSAS